MPRFSPERGEGRPAALSLTSWSASCWLFRPCTFGAGAREIRGTPAGQEGLEPTTAGFRDRCATNCATALGLHSGHGGTEHDKDRTAPPGAFRSSEPVLGPDESNRTSLPGPSDNTCVRASHRGGTLARVNTLPRVSTRLAAIAPSATLAVDARAKALKAAGRPVIGFGAGEPDFPTPDYIVQAAIAACSTPANHRYTPAQGKPVLREAIAAKTLRDTGVEVAASDILVTNGGKQAVFQAFAAIVDEGDDVILPAPYWTTYPEAIRLAGGVPVEVFAGSEQDYKVTVEQLEAARTERTKALLLCSPSNPTGSVHSRAELEEIGRWALENGVWVITDEIYEHLVYDDAEFVSILKVVPDLMDTTIVLNGVAKTYAMTGWRVGWMFGPTDVIRAASNFQSHLTSNVNNVAQDAALAAVSGDLTAVAEMRTAFDRRRRLIVDELSKVPGFEVPVPKGAFYAYPNVEGALGREIRGRVATTSAELAAIILDEVEVAVVPGEAFGPSGYLRLSYATSDEDIVEGVGRIRALLTEG
nr:aminotransferase class I/II-fold pyridoxal phosphate-dependent enzyme [Actinomycetales bacterium]